MAKTRLTVALQVETMAPAQYLNYNFNSYCKVGSRLFGANEDGIFELEVADKDEVSATVKTPIDALYEAGPTDFGVRTEKRVRKVVVALEANGQIEMAFTVAEGEDTQVEVQKLPYFDDKREHVVEVPVGRDLKGRYFNWAVRNVNGADFSIDEIEGFVDILLRKPEKEGAN
jgi:hypothetical protein